MTAIGVACWLAWPKYDAVDFCLVRQMEATMKPLKMAAVVLALAAMPALAFIASDKSPNIYADFINVKRFSSVEISRHPDAKIAMIGDSWTLVCPDDIFTEPFDKFAYPGQSVDFIIKDISQQSKCHYETMYIVAGIANYVTLINGNISPKDAFSSTQENILTLADTAKRHFRADTVIICDLDRMLQWCENPANQALWGEFRQWHIRPEAYPSLLANHLPEQK